MGAPTADVVKFALVRSPRQQAAIDGRAHAIVLNPTPETADLLERGTEAELLERHGALYTAAFGDGAAVLAHAARLLGRLRGRDMPRLTDDQYVAALQAEFPIEGDLAPILSALADLYLVNLRLGRQLEVVEAGEAYKAVHALAKLQEANALTVFELRNPLVIVNLQPRPDPEGPDEPSQDGDNIRVTTELLFLRTAASVLDDLRRRHQLRMAGDEPQSEQRPASANADDEALVSRGTAVSRLVADVDLEAILPEPVTGFVKRKYGLADLNDTDIPTLLANLKGDLARRFRAFLQGRSSSHVLSFSKGLDMTAALLRDGQVADVDAAARSLAIGARPAAAAAAANIDSPRIADLKVVRQQLQRYALGEIAHIENVLQGETRSRDHHRGERIEQTFSYEEEQVSTSEKDLQTTERFELSQETERVLEEKRKTEAGLNVSASYGVVTVAAHAGMSNEQTIQESATAARSYVRETIAKASERLEKRTKKQTTVTTTFETTEDNKHSFSASLDSVVGIYRWVEKHYWCQAFNYGARAMFELRIPEPAAFYLYSLTEKSGTEVGLRPPDAPDFTAEEILEDNYLALAAPYGAAVTAPPPALIFAQIATLEGKEEDSNASGSDNGKVKIDGDYELISIAPIAAVRIVDNGRASYSLLVSPFLWKSAWETWPRRKFPVPVRGDFQLAFNGVYVQHYAISVSGVLLRTDEALATWQLTTFNAIQEAYLAQKSEYERKLAALEARRQTITARTDMEYRELERTELKRLAIQLITGQDFSQFDAMKHPKNAAPAMDAQEALREGAFVRFAEESFEWPQMVYDFYPYFWGQDDLWVDALARSGGDMAFQRFLRAGFSRVLVPVRPGMERHALYFLETGSIWNADQPPMPNKPEHIALVRELEKVNADENVTGVPEGSPWKQVIPTSLVCLEKEDQQLPSWEIQRAAAEIDFLPSEETCEGRPYNAAQWPADRRAVLTALSDLGYRIPETEDPVAYLRSAEGRRVVRAFQMDANEAGVATEIGSPLRVDGVIGACTLRALTVAVAMYLAGAWSKPA